MHTIYDTDLTNEHLVFMGKIFANWSLVEFQLTRILSKLLNIDIKLCRIIIQPLDARTKIKKIEELAKYQKIPKEQLQTLATIFKNINDIRDNRNLVAHGIWAQDENNNYYLVKYSNNNAQKPFKTKMPVADLEQIYKEITSLLSALDEWTVNLAFTIVE